MIASSFLPPESDAAVIAATKCSSALRVSAMKGSAAALLSTSTAICIGSAAGSTRSTSRATLSSRTTKSAGPRSGTGAPSAERTLTYIER